MKQKIAVIFLLAGIIFAAGSLQYKAVYRLICENYVHAGQKSEKQPEPPEEGESSDLETNKTAGIGEAVFLDQPNLNLYALSACLMDGSNGRVLYAKDAYHEMPMASTTKIMTLIVTLENADLSDVVTVSSNAARQPDVQLNINTGEQYYLRDLVYSLMLESHNDTAVAIAEHVGGSVEGFCEMMTAKAKAIGAMHTSFKTPNGLDADGHYTTAADLALIGKYAIGNKDFLKIVNTQTYQFNEISKGRSFTVNNKDRFLYMMEGAVGIKTGFTGKAGYCFVGAIQRDDGRSFISVVLGSGWPPNKEYKWSDTKKLMNLGLDQYTEQVIFSPIEEYRAVSVQGGIIAETMTEINAEVSLLLNEKDQVEVKFQLPKELPAPVAAGEAIGTADIYINQVLYQSLPITAKNEVKRMDYSYCIQSVLSWFLFH